MVGCEYSNDNDRLVAPFKYVLFIYKYFQGITFFLYSKLIYILLRQICKKLDNWYAKEKINTYSTIKRSGRVLIINKSYIALNWQRKVVQQHEQVACLMVSVTLAHNSSVSYRILNTNGFKILQQYTYLVTMKSKDIKSLIYFKFSKSHRNMKSSSSA